jgi:hypothetical protein
MGPATVNPPVFLGRTSFTSQPTEPNPYGFLDGRFSGQTCKGFWGLLLPRDILFLGLFLFLNAFSSLMEGFSSRYFRKVNDCVI